MKVSPYVVIGSSAVLAVVALSLFFYETSPEVTDAPPTPVVVEQDAPTQDAPRQEAPEPEQPAAQAEDPDAVDAEVTGIEGATGINLARVRPDGSAVVAGQAPAGSTINMMENGQIIGTTTASSSGEWVIIPDALLAEGSHLLSIEIIAPDGTMTIGAMALAIEIPAGGKDTPLVALVPYTEVAPDVTTILQVPESLDPTPAAEADAIASDDANQNGEQPVVIPNLNIRSISAISPAEMSISGKAEGGQRVELTVNDGAITVARPDDKSLYTATLAIAPDAATMRLHGRLLGEDGATLATVKLKLSRGQFEQGLGGNALIVVQKGDALWRIAYKTYGQGIRYVDIYRQNQSSIQDPDLIYPDQIFVVPNGG
ncbi:MAG: LysM peptidoglycan-binding domain-containing protein [Alphaproteobacteria bacterium]|nr:LysM peptidoglycan-binding domain-containing protein [Alphaproteobacteria bacterium]